MTNIDPATYKIIIKRIPQTNIIKYNNKKQDKFQII